MQGRVAVLMLGLVATGGSLWAQPMVAPSGRWWERPRVAAELGLTVEQKDALEAATVTHARAMLDLKAAVEKAQLELRIVSEAEPFNPASVRERFAALQQARLRLEAERFEMLIKTREVVTPAQWRELARVARERRARSRAGEGESSVETAPRRPQRPRGF